jgi:hypothetical protein
MNTLEIVPGLMLCRSGLYSIGCPELALKRPTVALAEGLLIEAVLKHACVVPNRP